jgi:cytochrome c
VDSFEFNKIAGWLLACFLSIMAIHTFASAVFHRPELEKAAIAVPDVDVGGATEAVAAGPAEPPIEALLQTASAEKGASQFKKCAACHTIEKGGANKTGPNLYGIVGASHAHIDGFAYSDANLALKGKPWTWQELNGFLTSPKKHMPGTKMAFAGLSKGEDRADLLVFLNQNSDNPLPLPAAPAPVADAAPAEAPAAEAPAAEAQAPAADAAPAATEAAPAQ